MNDEENDLMYRLTYKWTSHLIALGLEKLEQEKK